MAREKIVIKKIEKKAARHVTFSKRRRGLIKKAQELSILCEADVAVVIFSATGKLFEYSSSSMKMILEKYIKCSNPTQNNGQSIPQVENQDTRRMKQQFEDVSRNLRRMRGENLEGLTIKELQRLENKLEDGLNKVRSKKGMKYLEENAKLRLQLNEIQCCHVENNNIAEESLFIEPLETQSSESTVCTGYNLNLHKPSMEDTSLQLGLSI